MTDNEIAKVTAEYATKYPALISLDQAAAIAQVPIGTLYDWSSRGFLDAFKSVRGRHRRLVRDAFVRWLLGETNVGMTTTNDPLNA